MKIPKSIKSRDSSDCRLFQCVFAIMYVGIVLASAEVAIAVTGLADSPVFWLDTRTFQGTDSPFFQLDTRSFQGQDSPLFTLDTRTMSTVPDAVGRNRLLRCTPNPFNPATRIEFEIFTPGPVSVLVYDVRGRLVQGLLHEVHFESGLHGVVWRGDKYDGSPAASGVYFVRCLMGKDASVRSVVLVK